MAKITAYAWASGLIELGQTLPDGALPIITGEEKRIRDFLYPVYLKPVTNMKDVMH